MNRNQSRIITPSEWHPDPRHFRSLSHSILQLAKEDVTKADFLCRLAKTLLEFSHCEETDFWFINGGKCSRCHLDVKSTQKAKLDSFTIFRNFDGRIISHAKDNTPLEKLCLHILNGEIKYDPRYFTLNDSFWIGKESTPLELIIESAEGEKKLSLLLETNYKSLAIIPLSLADQKIGLLIFKSVKTNFFTRNDVEFYEGIAETLGLALAYQNTQLALHERVKELTCLYGISQLGKRLDLSLEGILQQTIDFISPAWQYPDCTQCRIVFNNAVYQTPNFTQTSWSQSADIIINDEKRGLVQVVYTSLKPNEDEGPFLKEERNLINTIAHQIAIIAEQRMAEDEKIRLREQLLHADRLATIGQLGAGVAHELNEPLTNILGFAQLVKKNPELPEQISQDIENIIESALYSRDVIKKLLIFSRQAPSQKIKLNLNHVITSGLNFFKRRLERSAIELQQSLDPNLPEIMADPAQMNQIIVNLVVNAIQAMPGGGCLRVETKFENNAISLVVEDNGIGMSEEIQKKIFLPFFTTKKITQGTGLGLSVVHGIVTSHKGTISVQSEEGRGTRFTVKFLLNEMNEM